MHKLVVIDLTHANISLFDAYEQKVIPLISLHGGRIEQCVRSLDGTTETHLLHFPDASSFDKFLADPLRTKLQTEWLLTGAITTVTSVKKIDYL